MNRLPHIQSPTRCAMKIIAIQGLILLCLTLLLLCWGYFLALSFVMGAIVVVLPTAWFACRFFHAWRERSPKGIMTSLCMAEVAKLLFCGILAIFFVKYFPVRAGWFILGLAAAYLSFWLAVPFVIKTGKVS